jgi:tetratricopeptide (TPR) repeat protein
LVEYQNKITELKNKANTLFDNKKWIEARPVFDQLVGEVPDDYYVIAKAAGCNTWGEQADLPKGEKYALLCIELSPTTPNGYKLMAQNINRQQKYDQVVPWVKKLLDLLPQEDEPYYIVEGLAAAREALVQLDLVDQLQPLVDIAIELYPKLKEKLQQVC